MDKLLGRGTMWSCYFLFAGRTSLKTVTAAWIQRKENVLLPPTMTVQPIVSLHALCCISLLDVAPFEIVGPRQQQQVFMKPTGGGFSFLAWTMQKLEGATLAGLIHVLAGLQDCWNQDVLVPTSWTCVFKLELQLE